MNKRIAYYVVAAFAIVALVAHFAMQIISSHPSVSNDPDYPSPIYREPGVIYISEPPTYSKQTLMDNIEYDVFETMNHDLVVSITNHNSISVDVTIEIEVVDENGIVTDDDYDYLDALDSNKTVYVLPYLEGYTPDEVSVYLDCEAATSVSLAKYITFETHDVDEYGDIPVTATNTSDYEPSSVYANLIFYDENETIVGIRPAYFFDLYAKASETDTVMPPFDENYDDIPYDHFEIQVVSAPCYDVEYIESE